MHYLIVWLFDCPIVWLSDVVSAVIVDVGPSTDTNQPCVDVDPADSTAETDKKVHIAEVSIVIIVS